MIFAHSTTKGVRRPLKPPPPPNLTPFKEPACPPQRVSKSISFLFLISWCSNKILIKPCLNSLSGLLSISVDWAGPRTLVENKGTEILIAAV